jgi:hypothetical protein
VDLETEITITAWLESALDSPYGIRIEIESLTSTTTLTPAYFYHKLITQVWKKFSPNYDAISIHVSPDHPDREIWLWNTTRRPDVAEDNRQGTGTDFPSDFPGGS